MAQVSVTFNVRMDDSLLDMIIVRNFSCVRVYDADRHQRLSLKGFRRMGLDENRFRSGATTPQSLDVADLYRQ